MNKFFSQIKATVAVAAIASTATLMNIPQADAASFQLSWLGLQGYSATGQFTFDDSFLGSTVTRDELSDFAISFFDPAGNLVQSFDYDFPNPNSSFNFNFDTVSQTVLQTDNFDTPNGFDLGIDFATEVEGLSFYTFVNPNEGVPNTTIFLKDDLSPEACTVPNCRLDIGGQLTATLIPEPGAIFGLLVVGSLSRFLKKKPASILNSKSE
ncbi:PEP-CTERM sorting domain-containing protein [Fortiea sp. LEGE XX443]|uniref:PEP-CTERM sorting domain-containing protein n=1 Tax=Fortiea sp. LEGE XX443 TaxID=1828611 RepID=UPI00187F282A|nr:PEP-CTERM sorting domain-containing protein [Fortiea sp. LEGE XX443]MBE9005204.1 PEP-CTERM sorting domain-containing protein [Fortiea sp. LEGE XX443]